MSSRSAAVVDCYFFLDFPKFLTNCHALPFRSQQAFDVRVTYFQHSPRKLPSSCRSDEMPRRYEVCNRIRSIKQRVELRPRSKWGGVLMSHEKYATCIEACVACAQECEHCADACLSNQNVKKMGECIRLDRDCAEICWVAAAYMSRDSRFANDICRLCAEICAACGAECEKHPANHCQRCAEACHRCAEECRQMAGVSA